MPGIWILARGEKNEIRSTTESGKFGMENKSSILKENVRETRFSDRITNSHSFVDHRKLKFGCAMSVSVCHFDRSIHMMHYNNIGGA